MYILYYSSKSQTIKWESNKKNKYKKFHLKYHAVKQNDTVGFTFYTNFYNIIYFTLLLF